jgi:outer membrane murein-binding lipoprotein Lpp
MKQTKKLFYVAPIVGSFLLFAPSVANAACPEADNYAFQIRTLESQKASLNRQLCYTTSCSSLTRMNITRQIDSIRSQITTLNSLKQTAIRNCMNPVKKK